MKYKFIGNDKLKLSSIGLGCMGMAEFYGITNDQESIKIIKRAYELGVNHFDTADMYGMGHGELLVGNAIKMLPRKDLVIATKCGFVRNESGEVIRINGTYEYIKRACEYSLKRLNIDYIDLFYLHRLDPNTPIEISMQALSDLVKEGKIRNIGLCEVSPETIVKANSIAPLSAIQSEYSILHRYPEKEIIPLCKKLGLIFVAFSPLSRGLLTGKLNSFNQLQHDDFRRILPRFQPENISYNLNIVEILSSFAKKTGSSPAQIALSWLLNQDDHIVAIPGTKNLKYLEENIDAIKIILSEKDMQELNDNVPLNFAKGAAFPKEIYEFLEKH